MDRPCKLPRSLSPPKYMIFCHFSSGITSFSRSAFVEASTDCPAAAEFMGLPQVDVRNSARISIFWQFQTTSSGHTLRVVYHQNGYRREWCGTSFPSIGLIVLMSLRKKFVPKNGGTANLLTTLNVT